MLLLEGALPFAIILFSALLHELGHIAAIRCCGTAVRRVDILPMGALIVFDDDRIDYRQDMLISLSGPLFSLLGACCASCVFFILREPYSLFAVLVNLLLALLNLIPEQRLDGGRALLSYLLTRYETEKAEHISSAVSSIAKSFFLALALSGICLSGFNAGVLILVCFSLMQMLL